ncbi:ROK family protein [candidate division WOR-3 bacterium]|nr:ROK family protein [candidate division WOR-3 bacterium]
MRIVGIDVGGTYIKSGVVGTNSIRASIPPAVQSFKSLVIQPKDIVKQIIEIVKTLNPEALGIGIAGLVDKGIIYSSPNLPQIKNLKLKEILESKLHIPVSVANDADMVALGEWKYGAGKGTHNLLLLTLGTGVGGGLIINDKLYTGSGFAGEVGHITIDPDGPLCGCGNYGCLETFVGSKYLTKRALQEIKSGIKTSLSRQIRHPPLAETDGQAKYSNITPEVISKEAYKGDSFAKSIIETAGHYLGIGIASLCAILDPDKVIIGGGISKAGEILFAKIREEINLRLYSRKDIEILPTSLGDKAGISGSAFYIFRSNKKL